MKSICTYETANYASLAANSLYLSVYHYSCCINMLPALYVYGVLLSSWCSVIYAVSQAIGLLAASQQLSIQLAVPVVCCYKQQGVKSKFSSQWWPLSTLDPAHVLHTHDTDLRAKFCHCTSRWTFRSLSHEHTSVTFSYYVDDIICFSALRLVA